MDVLWIPNKPTTLILAWMTIVINNKTKLLVLTMTTRAKNNVFFLYV